MPLLVFGACGLNAQTLIYQSQDSSAKPDNPSNYHAVSSKSESVNTQLLLMIEQLQEEVQGLRGVVEEQQNHIRLLKKNAKKRYVELDQRVLDLTKRLSESESVGSGLVNNKAVLVDVSDGVAKALVENTASPANVGAPQAEISKPTSMPKPAGPGEKQAYDEAYALVKKKQFDQAIARFYEFIEKYPDGDLAGNAYYWLGEVYLVLPQLEQAEQAFSIVVRAYENHPKVADAMYKLGVTLDRMQKPAESEVYLLDVQKRFPDSTAARLARSYKINR